MSKAAVTARLRSMARMLEERGFQPKGVDMSKTAITARLRSMAALSDLCLRLGHAKLTPPPR